MTITDTGSRNATECAVTRFFLAGHLCAYRMSNPPETTAEQVDDLLSVALHHLAQKAYGRFPIS